LAASCGDDGSEAGEAITVFAASSLSEAFTAIAGAFEAANPGAAVNFSFAASSDLAAQIAEGAPADVFASADLINMTRLTEAGNTTGEPVVFAGNVAEIIVAAGNPEGITGVDDLANEDLIVVLCAPEVPCGRYANTILQNADVALTPKSLEQNVKAVVTKVTLGEADAGIVYATDLVAAGADASGVAIPEDINVVAEYPIAVIRGSSQVSQAQAFVDFVVGEQGRQILSKYGFLAP
jgi:molybdate transport system substrate-binding protein